MNQILTADPIAGNPYFAERRGVDAVGSCTGLLGDFRLGIHQPIEIHVTPVFVRNARHHNFFALFTGRPQSLQTGDAWPAALGQGLVSA